MGRSHMLDAFEMNRIENEALSCQELKLLIFFYKNWMLYYEFDSF